MGSSQSGTKALKMSGEAEEGEAAPGVLGVPGAPAARVGLGLGGGSCLRERLPGQVRVLQQLEKKRTAKHGRGQQLGLPAAPHSSLCFKE